MGSTKDEKHAAGAGYHAEIQNNPCNTCETTYSSECTSMYSYVLPISNLKYVLQFYLEYTQLVVGIQTVLILQAYKYLLIYGDRGPYHILQMCVI